MPPPPELGDRAGDIGVVEVLQKPEAEHVAQTDGHIRVGGEVKVDLEGVGQGAHPGQAGVQVGRRLIEDPVGNLPHGVSQHHLFGQTEAEAGDAGGKLRKVLLPVGDLRHDGGVPDDGAGHQLGEQGHIQGHVQGVLLNGGVSPVHVDDVAEPLKGEERDADGQSHLGDGDSKAQAVNGLSQKSGVLEPPQQPQPHRRGEDHPEAGQPPVRLTGQQAAQVVDQNGKDHEEDQLAGPPPVEK